MISTSRNDYKRPENKSPDGLVSVFPDILSIVVKY
jgi:hypothetical protein